MRSLRFLPFGALAFIFMQTEGPFEMASAADRPESSILKIDLEDVPPMLDPAANMTNSGWYILNSVSLTLFDMDQDQSLRGLLAESWQSFENGKRYRVTIRKDAYFHNGKPVTVDDVIFSLKRKQTTWPEYELFNWMDPLKNPKAIHKVAPHTIEFQLNKPYPYFLFVLALPGTGVVPQEIYPSDRPLAAEKLPVLAGPYRFVEWKKGDFIKLAWFDKYFEPRGNRPDSVTISIRDDQQKLERFLSGETNLYFDKRHHLSRKDEAKRKSFQVFYPRFNSVGFAYLNTLSGPLKDKKLRGIFVEAMRRYFQDRESNPEASGLADQFFPPGYSGRTGPYITPTPQKQFDVEFERLRKDPVQIRYTYPPDLYQGTPPFFGYMKKLGFEIVPVIQSDAEIKKARIETKGFDLGFWFIPIPPGDPCLVFRLDFGKDDFFIKDPNNGRLYEMIARTNVSGSLEDRIALAREISTYISEEQFIVPLYFKNMPIYSNSELDLSKLPKWQFNVKFSDVLMRTGGQR